MDWYQWVREHAAHLIFNNRKSDEINRVNRLARRRASMNETELEQNAQQIASTLINIHTESQEENKRMYDTMKGHVKAVWNGRQLGFLKSTSDTAEFPGRAELADALHQGWDIKQEVRKTAYFDPLTADELAKANKAKKDADLTFRPGRPPKTSEHARKLPAAQETWATWRKKFVNHSTRTQ